MSSLVVGPFNRVEGDLEVTVETADGAVREARVGASLYRGFEHILLGRPAGDALAVAPRVCGICSLSHSVAAARALAAVSGVEMPVNGRLALNLALATEVIADHLTHFHMFFMPDFTRPVYEGEAWFAAAGRFQTNGGEAQARFLPARARLLHLLGGLVGKWPHSLAIQPGGTSRAVAEGEPVRLLSILGEFRAYLETYHYGGALEEFAELDSLSALGRWSNEAPVNNGDLRLFLHMADELELDRLGRGEGRFMSSGAHDSGDGPLYRPGIWDGGPGNFDPDRITEDVSHTWMDDAGNGPCHPRDGATRPDADKAEGYTWAKAPRLSGKTMEVGALARQMVDGHPLIRDWVERSGANVTNRIAARMIEVAHLVPEMERWVRALTPGEPFFADAPSDSVGSGVGLVEAARGTLGHWLEVEDGRLVRYQIVSPTTWNFSPRDGNDCLGPVESALVGTPVRKGEENPIAVQHVVRSFDPCMACTVH